MIIVGIDTSCDDTCVSVLKIEGKNLKILSNVVSSQVKLHAKYGGVFPTLAKREHQKNLPIVFEKALKIAKNPKIDLISVTIGPGLEPCLWQGVNFAKDLAKKLNLAIVPANHIEAHVFSSFLSPSKFKILNQKIFPTISLVVSGGHTELILVENIKKYKILGQTRDDAAGECLDKVARLLGLGYPGGPAIEKYSKYKIKELKYKIRLPRPMINQKNYDFSFAGLKTAVLYDFLKRPKKERNSRQYKIEMAKKVQEAVVEVLVEKTFRAIENFKAKSLFLGGGVVANFYLRKKFKEKAKNKNINYFLPEIKFCTDNGAMVALVGFLQREKATKNYDKIEAEANLEI